MQRALKGQGCLPLEAELVLVSFELPVVSSSSLRMTPFLQMCNYRVKCHVLADVESFVALKEICEIGKNTSEVLFESKSFIFGKIKFTSFCRLAFGMSEERFNVAVHRNGTLVNDIPFQYVGGEMTYWSVDLDKWSYFEVVDVIKELRYIKVTNIFYCVENILHKLVDDRGAMNMVNVAKYFGEVHLFVVHGVDDEPEVVENEVIEQVLLLCHGSLNSGEDSHVGGDGDEVEVQGLNEVEGLDDEVEVRGLDDEVQGEEEEEVEVEDEQQEEVYVEDFTSNVSDDVGEVHGDEGQGHEEQRDVDEGEGDEGLMDVDINVYEVLLNNIEGVVSVELNENEESGNSDFLATQEESGSEDAGDERQSSSPFGTFVMQKSILNTSGKNYAVHGGRNLNFIKNDNKRVRVRCMGVQKSCPWMAYCGYLEGCRTWQMRKILDNHTCSRQFNIKMMNAKWLSETLGNSLHENPNLKINEIHSKALRKCNTDVTISKARRAKIIASCKVEGSFKNRFKRIYDYAHELLRCNPGSTVKVKVDSDNGETTFQRFYVCLKAYKVSFVSCRPFIGLDGCFLKGKYKGELLTTIGRNPNDQMLPLAYAIMEVENKDS
ncbi:hypothetical protein V8G54_028030 [Vigna mungo]|uniref:PB1-like domain-containing protein n=1 Tax=Vigna mungo TaxID=3915 RepID=A0AAQ3MSM3_VIGMU